jgi:hypothetical protein
LLSFCLRFTFVPSDDEVLERLTQEFLNQFTCDNVSRLPRQT